MPGILAARIWRNPAAPPIADRLVLSFSNTLKLPSGIATAVFGNPVRPAIAALRGQDYLPPAQKIELLILGGSLGAKVFGTLIPAALALLPEDLRARLSVTQQCRAEDLADARNVFRNAGIDADLSPFFYDVAARLARAQLVIARAGASTVAELGVAGRPSILVPLPNAIDDHQRANANALAEVGGAWRMDQAALTPELLAEKIATLLNSPQMLQTAAAAAARYGKVDAAERLAALVQDMMAMARA